jgi:hypothetical protein
MGSGCMTPMDCGPFPPAVIVAWDMDAATLANPAIAAQAARATNRTVRIRRRSAIVLPLGGNDGYGVPRGIAHHYPGPLPALLPGSETLSPSRHIRAGWLLTEVRCGASIHRASATAETRLPQPIIRLL